MVRHLSPRRHIPQPDQAIKAGTGEQISRMVERHIHNGPGVPFKRCLSLTGQGIPEVNATIQASGGQPPSIVTPRGRTHAPRTRQRAEHPARVKVADFHRRIVFAATGQLGVARIPDQDAKAPSRGESFHFLARAEIAAAQSAILAARFPGGVNLGDVMADDFVERARAVCPDGYDLAVATPPCIDFSVGGKRRGIDAEHGRLTLRTADILENNGVRYWLIENVPNLLSSNGGHDFGKLLARLAGADHDLVHPAGSWTSLGYVVGPHRHVAWRIVDAQHFGLPQRRRRVFILVTPDESALNIFN